MKSFPLSINDGQYDYVLVRNAEKLPDGRENLALYDRVPLDEDFQYTPNLEFVIGKVTKPSMLKIAR